MATFKAEVQNKRADGTYNVRIRVTHNREVRRISTNIYITDDRLTRSLKIKNVNMIEKCDDLIKKCRKACNDLRFELFDIPIDDLVTRIKKHLQGGDKFYLDFIQYTKDKADKTIYITKYQHEADEVISLHKYKSEADLASKWHITTNKEEADEIIYLVSNRNEADKVVYICEDEK